MHRPLERHRLVEGLLGAVLFLLAVQIVTPPLLAKAELLEERRFELRKEGEDEAIVEVGNAGTMIIRVDVRQPIASAPVKIFLEGPDGLQVEKSGPAPLSLRFRIDASRVGRYRAVVSNVGKMARLTGRLRVEWKEAPSSGAPDTTEEPAEPDPPALTDGEILYPEDRQLVRAVCRDRNEDIFLRLDLDEKRGAFFLHYHPVFDLETGSRSDEGVIPLRGDGETTLILDEERKILTLGGDLFCRVRLFYGEPLGE